MRLKLSLLLLFSFINLFGFTDTTSSSRENTISFNSIPSGAQVFIGDSVYGKTPVVIRGLPKGKFAATVQDGIHDPFQCVFTLEETNLEFYPVLDGQYGILNVNCSEKGAKILINDSLWGITPCDEIKLDNGICTFKVIKDSFITFSTTLNIHSNVRNINVDLQSIFGFISFSDDLNGEVYLDGEQLREFNSRKLPIGNHYVSILPLQKSIRQSSLPLIIYPGKSYKLFSYHNSFSINNFLYSFIVPGLGQFREKSYLKGSAILAVSFTTALLLYNTNRIFNDKKNSFDQKRTLYLNARNETEAGYYRDIMLSEVSGTKSAQKNRNISLGVFAGALLYNWIDVLLNHSFGEELHLIEIKPNAMNINLNLGK